VVDEISLSLSIQCLFRDLLNFIVSVAMVRIVQYFLLAQNVWVILGNLPFPRWRRMCTQTALWYDKNKICLRQENRILLPFSCCKKVKWVKKCSELIHLHYVLQLWFRWMAVSERDGALYEHNPSLWWEAGLSKWCWRRRRLWFWWVRTSGRALLQQMRADTTGKFLHIFLSWFFPKDDCFIG
jgi:hypothetical protein